MKAYWDSSALVEATFTAALRDRLKAERGFTRTHSLAEIFSTLTGGNLAIRVDANIAAETVDDLIKDLDFIDLNADEVSAALKEARKRGVRGGRVHDYLHAIAAEKSGVKELLTLDQNDFENLVNTVTIEQV